MALEHLHEKRDDIMDLIIQAVQNALRPGNLNEPQLVANLVFQIPNILNPGLQSLSSKTHIQIGGVFVHQTPKAQPVQGQFPHTNPASVEIGDVLFVSTHKRKNGSIDRNALLMQAKVKSNLKTSFTLPASEQNQHYLYAFWPEFKYVRSTQRLNGKRRKITGPLLYQGANYLLADSDRINAFRDKTRPGQFQNSFSHCLLGVYQPQSPKLYFEKRFTGLLYDLIFGNAGRPFQLQPSANNMNWDQVMTDLIDVTAAKTTAVMRRAGDLNGQRGQGLFFATGACPSFLRDQDGLWENILTRDELPPKVPSERGGDDDPDGGGISIIEFYSEEFDDEG